MTKKFIISFFTFLSITALHAQNVVFNDPVLKKFLLNMKNINANDDDEISLNEAMSATALHLSPSVQIRDLTGLESFVNLKKLILRRINITDIDLSKNIHLTYLDLSGNPLRSLNLEKNSHIDTLICSNTNLNQIELFHQIELKYAEFNLSNLTSIDVSMNLKLTYLSCNRSNLSNINVSKNKSLQYLDCSFNLIHQLDISHNTELTVLFCSNNILTSLDVSQNSKLVMLICSQNNLKRLDLSLNPQLVDLRCNNTGLQTLNISKNPNLYSLLCSNNNLTELEISNNILLDYLYCSGNDLKSLDVSKQALDILDCTLNPNLNIIYIRSFADIYRGEYVKDEVATWIESTYNVEFCTNYITNTSICDNFLDADPNTSQIEEYAIPTDKPRWDNGIVVPHENAYKGIFWTEASNHNGFSAVKSRRGDGVLRYSITQPKNSYEPFLLVLGSYADGNEERKFSLDLTKDKIVSFDLKNKGDTNISFYVQLEDIHGNNLVFDKYYQHDIHENFYYQIGYGLFSHFNLYWSDDKFIYPNGKSNFSYDFANGVCGVTEVQDGNNGEPVLVNVPKPDIIFDYSHVTMVKFFISGFAGHLSHSDLNNYPIEISNLKIGSIPVVNSETNTRPLTYNNEIYTAYDLLGNMVDVGEEMDLKLSIGKVYILKCGTIVKKKVIVE